MKRKRITSLVLALLAVGLTVFAALAMSSDNYRLDWMELPSSSAVAASSSSTNYKISDSFGAPFVIGLSGSNTRLELGYWPSAFAFYRQHLPYVGK